jgi:hypothetical protein
MTSAQNSAAVVRLPASGRSVCYPDRAAQYQDMTRLSGHAGARMYRALFVLAACVLCGCSTISIPVSRCVGQLIIPNARTTPCLASPEYYNARKKARQSIKEDAQPAPKKTDPRYEEWLP